MATTPRKTTQSEARTVAEETAKAVAEGDAGPSGALPEQTFQAAPNPELQAALTDPAADRQEQHVLDEAPDDADRRTAEAPGIRSEPEVIADHIADNERAAAALTAAGHTADPAVSTSAVKFPRVENRDRLVHFKRVRGPVGVDLDTVQSVNEGTPEHGILLADADFEETTAPKADA